MRSLWVPLKPGDTVYIVAPCGKSLQEQAVLDRFCEVLLTEWGVQPRFSKTLFGEGRRYYHFANSHSERLSGFIEAMESDASVVFTLRGGYGSDWITEALIERPISTPLKTKLFVGYSDVTTLHAFIQNEWSWPSVHGLSRGDAHLQKLKSLLFGEHDYIELALQPLNLLSKGSGQVATRVVGGNLSVVQTGLGTPWALAAKERVVLLEDVGEAPYRIARMLHQLHAARYFHGAHAVVFGDFLYTGQGKSPEQIQDEMDDVLDEFGDYAEIPTFRRRGIGHSLENIPVPLNTSSRLVLGRDATLKIAAPHLSIE